MGFTNELFKPNIIGSDLLESFLVIINRAKEETEIPKPFIKTAITNIDKQKGKKITFQVIEESLMSQNFALS